MTENLKYGLILAAIIICSYLIGNLSWAAVLAKWRGKDIKKQGSGNPGTMNMLRTFGFKMAILTLVLDALKGIIPAVAAYYIMQTTVNYGTTVDIAAPMALGFYTAGVGKLYMFVAGVSAIIGHIFPVFSKFKGGKGVGTTVGLFFAFDPLIMLGVFFIAFLYLMFFKYGSVASFIIVIGMSIVESILALVFHDNWIIPIICLMLTALILWAHRTNIKRLINGTESNSNLLEKMRKLKAKKQETAGTENNNTDTNGNSDGGINN